MNTIQAAEIILEEAVLRIQFESETSLSRAQIIERAGMYSDGVCSEILKYLKRANRVNNQTKNSSYWILTNEKRKRRELYL